MHISIDDCGDFQQNSEQLNFFIAVILINPDQIQQKFIKWEKLLPSFYKNSKGEIKGKKLSKDYLINFTQNVLLTEPIIPIIAVSLIPQENPLDMVNCWKEFLIPNLQKGAEYYKSQGSDKQADVYFDFPKWILNLSYENFIKLQLLGECISKALSYTTGYVIARRMDYDLINLKFFIDRDFIKEGQSNTYWHEILRNQIFYGSQRNPINLLPEWIEKGHPFLEKYAPDGNLNLNELFWNNTNFVDSKEYFGVRISDIIGTILHRHYNLKNDFPLIRQIESLMLKDHSFKRIIFEKPKTKNLSYNPWEHKQDFNIFNKETI